MKDKYKQAFMCMAEIFAQTSEAQRLKVGCLIVKDDKIISQSVNGTVKGWHTNNCEDENGDTQWFTQHAEQQALNKLRRTHETSVGATMFVTHSPCKMCCLQIIDAGISTVYYRNSYRDLSGIDVLREHGIEVEKLAK